MFKKTEKPIKLKKLKNIYIYRVFIYIYKHTPLFHQVLVIIHH